GHAALIALALLEAAPGSREQDILAWVRERCVFTTHTPVPAGHDRFSLDLAQQILGEEQVERLRQYDLCPDGELNMTTLALRASRFANGVAKRHADVSREMFPGVKIAGITNGIHHLSWIAKPMAA